MLSSAFINSFAATAAWPPGATDYAGATNISGDGMPLPPLAVWGNLVIYIAAWALLMWPQFLPLGRPGIAFVFAALACALRALCAVLWPKDDYAALDVFGKIEVTPLALLFGLMLVNAYIKDTGIWDQVEFFLDSASPRMMLTKICTFAAVMSALLLNDTTCFVLTPVVLNLCAKRGARSALPFLLGLTTSSNIGSCLTIIGNPQNALIAVTCPSITFMGFAHAMLAPVCAGLVLNTAALLIWYRSAMVFDAVPAENADNEASGASGGSPSVTIAADLERMDSEECSSTTPRTSRSWLVYVAMVVTVVVAMLSGWICGLATDDVALGAGAALMFVRALRRRSAWKDTRVTEADFGFASVDYSILLLFAGQFVLVGATVDTGLPQHLCRCVLGSCATNLAGSPGCMFGFAALVLILSNAIGNVPVILMLQPLLANQSASSSEALWISCAWVATIAGNFTMLGSAANLIVAHGAESQGEHGFTATYMAKFSMPPTLAVMAVGLSLLPPVGTALASNMALAVMVCMLIVSFFVSYREKLALLCVRLLRQFSSRESVGLFMLATFSAAEGLGPFQMAWLTANPVKSHSPEELGILGSVTQALMMVLMPVCGMMVDRSPWKRSLLGIGSICVGVSVAVTVFAPGRFWLQVLIQLPMALGMTLVPVSLAALTLGTMRTDNFTKQVAINNVGCHVGTVLSSSAMALSAAFGPKVTLQDGRKIIGPVWSIVPLAMSLLTVLGLGMIRYGSINHIQAAGGCEHASDIPRRDDVSDSRDASLPLHKRLVFWQVLALCFTFNFTNMPQLMLLVQQASATLPNDAIYYTSAAQLIAHFGMIISSAVAGHIADGCGRKPLLVAACCIVTIRALLTAGAEFFWISRGSSPWLGLLPCQGLDGIGAGLWGVLLMLLARDVSIGTGNFNLALGCAQAVFNAGGVASSSIAGLAAGTRGFSLAYLILAGSGFVAVMQASAIPETFPVKCQAPSRHSSPSSSGAEIDADLSSSALPSTSSLVIPSSACDTAVIELP